MTSQDDLTSPLCLQAELGPGCDVWAFAVTLWEVLTWCRLQPLAHLCDSAVTERLASYRAPQPEPHLQQPNACPAPLYQLMLHCWRLQSQSRPAFADVRAALRRSGQDCAVGEDDGL